MNERTPDLEPTDRFGDAGGTFRRPAPRGRTRYGRRRMYGEEGYVLAMTALLILPLMVFVSFAIDAGAWYAQASRMQRAADAAALAAVVWLPNSGAAATARDTVAAQNGYTTGVSGGPTSETTYRVTITADAPRFFSATFDDSDFGLTRTATAEFNKPVPMGSPTNRMGNDVADCPQFQPSQTAPCGPQPMLWSSIQGPYETFANGDPYATKCGRNLAANASACSSGPYLNGATNELYRTTGYEFAIDVKEADVGRPIQLQVWDAGSYQRSKTAVTSNTTVSMSNGSAILNRTGGTSFNSNDVGRTVTGTGIPANTIVASFQNSNRITLSRAVTSTSSSRTVTLTTIPDCYDQQAPFNASPYYGNAWTTQHCQTGDSTSNSPFYLQVFDNDGEDLTVNYDTPLAGCTRYVGPGAEAATYKNKWQTFCTITPTMTGIYPVRVKSSAIPGYTDTGSGYNQYSMKLVNATTTRLYALNDLSIWTNTPASDARFYLAEIGPEHAGKRLQLDLYDPGDGDSGQYTMQVLAPPSGSPAVVPTSGTVIPSAGWADSCRYNPTASPTRGPDVAAPNGSAANNCQVTTKFSNSGSGHYNNSWLRIEVKIANNYTCTTDCWWSIRYNFGTTGSLPTDRTVWSLKIVGDPVHLTE